MNYHEIEELEEHAEFQIRIMYREFRLQEQPIIPSIKLFRGHDKFIPQKNIILQIEYAEEYNKDKTMRRYALGHEISHYLHYSRIKEEGWRRSQELMPESIGKNAYREMIAEMATLAFYEKGGRTEKENYKKIVRCDKTTKESRLFYNNLHEIYEEKPRLWQTLIYPTPKNVEEVKRILRTHTTLKNKLRKIHEEPPEIIALPIIEGNKEY